MVQVGWWQLMSTHLTTQWFVSQQECPLPPTPQHSLVLDLGQTGPGKRLTQRQPRSQAVNSTATFIPAATLLQIPAPTYSTSQPCSISGTKQQRKGHNLGLLLSGTPDTYTGGT